MLAVLQQLFFVNLGDLTFDYVDIDGRLNF
jgi:hypothetical protein